MSDGKSTGQLPVSVVVIARNEERNIAACLASASWAEERIVVDAESRDRTVAIAEALGALIVRRPWTGYADAKNAGIDAARNEWIFSLDADERVTRELATAIAAAVRPDAGAGFPYDVRRKAVFIGKWIRHCGWYPGRVVRLFRKSSARFGGGSVHERLEVAGEVRSLDADLLHYTDETLFHYLAKFNRYTTLAATDLRGRRRAAVADMTLRPAFQFFKMYLLRLGFLDGIHGLVLCLMSASYVWVKYAKLWEASLDAGAGGDRTERVVEGS